MLSPLLTNNSPASKDKPNDLYQQITKLLSFTNFLEEKVDDLLIRQQKEFFKSYKTHINQVQLVVEKMKERIREQERKIKQYESSGMMGQLFSRLQTSQKHLAELYDNIRIKDKTIQELRINLNLCRQENNRLKDLHKRNVRQEAQYNLKSYETKAKPKEIDQLQTYNTCHTEPKEQHKKLLTDQPDDNTQFESTRLKKLQSEKKLVESRLVGLRRKYDRVVNLSVRKIETRNELEEIFLQCVETAKKSICMRKRVAKFDLKLLNSEDKVALLVNFLQAEEVLNSIHQQMFGLKKEKEKLKTQYGETFYLKEKSKTLVDEELFPGINQAKHRRKK